MRLSLFALVVATGILLSATCAQTRPAAAPQDFEARYHSDVLPLLRTYCFECHNAETAEADVNLADFTSLTQIRQQAELWVRVRAMIDNRQMPPREAEALPEGDRETLHEWLYGVLRQEAESRAGDPGPVILRRLTNAEYDYAIQDLTGLSELNPTGEFPVDGAAGEGFTNVGGAQSMSPALVTKYLDAARAVASHVVLLPDGVGFSPHVTQRDRTDDLLRQIREFYARFSDSEGASAVDLQGVRFETNEGGRLPVRRSLTALRSQRDRLRTQQTTIAEVAETSALNSRYLLTLWSVLEASDEPQSPFLQELRRQWRLPGQDGLESAIRFIAASQSALWKFNTIGQIGREGGPASWLEAVSPLTSERELRLSLPPAGSDGSATVWLSATALGSADESCLVLGRQPRLVWAADSGRRPVLLRDVHHLAAVVRSSIAAESARTSEYLTALLHRDQGLETSPASNASGSQPLNADLLRRWAMLTGVGQHHVPEIAGRFDGRLENIGGFAEVNGWGHHETPSLLTNRSNTDIPLLTLVVPARGVVVHPSPALEAWAAWRSPFHGAVKVSGLVKDADQQCGNGATWRVELMTDRGLEVLSSGRYDNGGGAEFQVERNVVVREGDVVRVIVGPGDGNHSCDTTHVDLTLADAAPNGTVWNLASEIVDRVLEMNPLADALGHPDVWHFGATAAGAATSPGLPEGSALRRWVQAVDDGQSAEIIDALAADVQAVVTTAEPAALSEGDAALRALLLDWSGPLNWIEWSRSVTGENVVATDLPFGAESGGVTADAESLLFPAGAALRLEAPAELAAGAELVLTATVPEEAEVSAAVQVRLSAEQTTAAGVKFGEPFLVRSGTAAERELQGQLEEFRNLFPPAVCYTQIVPVDEVVTLRLFYREDDLLKRLLLTDQESAEIDRLWDQLFYISEEPIALTVAFEQLAEFATQDRPDIVEALKPLRQPILDRAEVFRERQRQLEPLHVVEVEYLAQRAWRHPLTQQERSSLRELYAELRRTELDHESSIQMLVARILSSPAFLYRREQAPAAVRVGPVADAELASRLSFFLWSSVPDEKLAAAAESGKLTGAGDSGGNRGKVNQELLRQTERMLRDDRSRRLAVQFACQWLHVRDFDRHNEKNEQLFPEFAELRGDMYEETVWFVHDLIRSNGSILDLLDSDHTFLNERLAAFYGVEGIQGAEFRRVGDIHDAGRGGVLGMATVLATQSGASRTSPILRGNWVYETLLGERLPRPPANVPQLPEAPPEGLTERQLIEKHSSAPECAGCHLRIDPYGFALEGFDAIGRMRSEPADTKTALPDGTPVDALTGLQQYLITVQREAFVRQFCRKLLGYALGRETQLSDEPLLDEMQKQLAENEFRFHTAVMMIVASEQFRNIRGTEWSELGGVVTER